MIEFRDINYSINKKPILKDINLTIVLNEFVAVIGPNGAGKSTLIKLLLNIIESYQGTIFIEGEKNTDWLRKKRIGYLPQKEDFNRQFPADVIDIALMGLAATKGIMRHFTKKDNLLAERYLEKVGILHLRNELIGNLSSGEWQRMLLARAMLTDSNYLILDEPEASIDKPGVTNFFDILSELHKQGKTIITISHDLHMINKYCTFLVCLNKTLHCHTETEMLKAEHIHNTFGDAVKLIEKDY